VPELFNLYEKEVLPAALATTLPPAQADAEVGVAVIVMVLPAQGSTTGGVVVESFLLQAENANAKTAIKTIGFVRLGLMIIIRFLNLIASGLAMVA